MERKYSVPSNPESRAFSGTTSEDLHAWSIYRQNLNSDFTDSALGSTDKSPLPYGNFQLRDTTVQSILSHPRYGPKSALGSNMYTYLKFGLPRVFPPNHNGSNRSATPQQHFIRNASTRPNMRGPKHASRGIRDGSSGYDSSDNETANPYKNNRKYRSDPDFRMQNFHSSYHIQQGGSPAHAPSVLTHQSRQNNPQWNRNKSISEANLLSVEYGTNKCHPIHNERGPLRADPRRNSVAEFGQHLHHHEMVDHGAMSNISRPMSKSESQFSVPVHRKGASLARSEYLAHEDQENVFLYPHLQVVSAGVWPENTSCFDSKPHLLLNDISFEARGGEILAIMSTSEKEGTALLDVIAGKTKPVLGEVILNGQHVKPRTLKNRVAYVQNNPHLCKDITALQTMHYHFSLKKPTDKLGYLKIDALDRINVLLEDLGLDQVRNTRVSSMTLSERRRLNVACHLLLDTDIVILDQPTKGMDIFDTFFLVEYLKQWANGGTGTNLGRIVILTLHPPTYEIFTMLSRILLISAGRTMFSGRRRDMLPYFALVDYPCPSYKNPSDYYLDLVTLDDLSAEAMLESSQRIEQLAEIFRQKQEPMSDPGPPSALPMTVQPSNSFIQATTLFMKAMSYSQPNTFLNWLTLIVIAASLSLINGAIFWDLPNTDNQLNLNDRLGYHYSVMTITCWPLLILLTCVDIMRNRNTIERDISDGLYGRFTYIFTKTLLNLFPSLFIWLIYIVPSYSMSGLYMQSTTFVYEGFYNYIGLMLLYLSSLQIFLTAFVYTISCPNTSAILSSIILTILFTISGFLVHLNDLPFYVKNLRYISPLSWLLPYFINRELSSEAIAAMSATNICRNKQVQHQDIIIQQPCPTPNGTQVLFNFNYLSTQGDIFEPDQIPILLIIFYFFLFIICTVSFIMQCCKSKKSSTRGENCANKP